MTERATFVSFLLDETGSMGSIADETVQGLNTYLETLQQGDAEIVFSLVSFNSNETRRRHVAVPVREVPPLARSDYRPNAMTPLIDASVKIIRATEEAVRRREDDPAVVIVIQTDGEENVSVEYGQADLALLVKEKTAAGWEFVFLGAGLDAFSAARRAGLHLDADQVVSYRRDLSRAVFAETAQNLADFAESGDAISLSYSPAQRARVGDEHTHRHLDPGGRRGRRKRAGASQSTVGEIDLSKSRD